MNTTLTPATSRAPFPYLGGKSRLLDWIYGLMPPRVGHLVDVFGGAGNIVLGCTTAAARTYNDIDGDLVNFMRVLRDSADELIVAIELTPHSREEYEMAFAPADDDIERARRTFTRISQSFGRTLVKSGFSTTIGHAQWGLSLSTLRIVSRVEGLPQVVQALRHICIEHLPYEELLEKYAGAGTYFYCDPPYPRETRTSGVKYGSESAGDDFDHARLIVRLQAVECQGWMLSTYPNDLYAQLLHGYPSHSKDTQANNNVSRTEILYTSQHGHNRGLFHPHV